MMLTSQRGFAQKDTIEIIKEFSKVLEFSSQENLSYTSRIKLSASPIIQPTDTMTTTGIFYKQGDRLYTESGQEETFLQDGLLIQINNARKSIWISKTEGQLKEELEKQTVTKQMETLFRQKYNIARRNSGTLSTISFDTRPNENNQGTAQSKVSLQYDAKTLLPQSLSIDIKVSEEADAELKEALKAEGINVAGLIQTINGTEFFVRTQNMAVLFEGISTAAATAMKIPSWKTRLEYNETAGDYKGIGGYSDYEVIKLY
ncbi:hypothetical protein EGI32_08510 [Ferruginibacter sp. HRS2-29]|nr:hypothetical protein [Ferruginibacter sp. HRS2-29]